MKPQLTVSQSGKQVLAKIRTIKPFIEGSLTTTRKRCGNPKCRCAKEGPVHETALLTWKEGNKTRTIYIPITLRKEVTQWVEEMKTLRDLIRRMSVAQREILHMSRKSKKV